MTLDPYAPLSYRHVTSTDIWFAPESAILDALRQTLRLASDALVSANSDIGCVDEEIQTGPIALPGRDAFALAIIAQAGALQRLIEYYLASAVFAPAPAASKLPW